jgi:hypothetical protein
MPQLNRWTLRDLPLAARLTVAVFLIAVGCGYGAAMVQVHFQDSRGGKLLPDGDDLVRKFHGDPTKQVSPLERLLLTPENEEVPFNGQGSMVRAFTDKSAEWKKALKGRPEAEVRKERDGERDAVLAWLHTGLSRADYDADKLPRPPGGQPITAEFLNEDGTVKIKTLFTERCVRCHQADGDDSKAAKFPLATYEQIKGYSKVDTGAMSLPALAQSTHTHLLAFAVLFCVTGLVFALSSYPAWLRVPLAPLVLTAQVFEIACWWLGRLDGEPGVICSRLVLVFGGLVGVGLAAQVVLGLFDLFGTVGKVVLVLLMIAAGCGVAVLKQQYVEPQLQKEAGVARSVSGESSAQRNALKNVSDSRAALNASWLCRLNSTNTPPE